MGLFTNAAAAVATALHNDAGVDGQRSALFNTPDPGSSRYGAFSNPANWVGRSLESTSNGHMAGTVIIKSHCDDRFFILSEQSTQQPGTEAVHVEENLFRTLAQRTDNYKNIPNQCKIITFVDLSPCQNCMRSMIPNFVNSVMRFGKKEIQFSLVYNKPYCEPWISSRQYKNVYPSKQNALDDYYDFARRIGKTHGCVTVNGAKRLRLTIRPLERTQGHPRFETSHAPIPQGR